MAFKEFDRHIGNPGGVVNTGWVDMQIMKEIAIGANMDGLPPEELEGQGFAVQFRSAEKNLIFESNVVHANDRAINSVIMYMQRYTKVLLTVGIAWVLSTACLRTDEYPLEPMITFDGFSLVDSVDQLGNLNTYCIVTIGFTDGDGNVGLRPGDTNGRYHPDSLYYHNLLVDYYEWNDSTNSFKLIEDLNPPFSARIPYLTPEGKNKTLKGDIVYDMNVSFTGSDTIRFDFRLVDRSFTESNTVESPPIYLN